MMPKSGNRLSEKIMLKEVNVGFDSTELDYILGMDVLENEII